MAGRSISLRLTVWFSSVYFAGLAAFGVVMWLDLKHSLTAGRSQTLAKRADRLAGLLDDMHGDLSRGTARFQEFADATGGGLIEALRPDGARAFPPPTAASRDFPWPKTASLGGERFSEVAFSGRPYRVLERPYATGTQALILCVASPLEGNRLELGAFTTGLLWTIPALLALSALGGYVLSRRALNPVGRIAAAIQSIGASNLARRLPAPKARDELYRLSEACNAMLARLEASVNEIKRFTADASHELRSPLSFMRTVAELGLRSHDADEKSKRAFEEIVEECGRTSRLLEDMLTLARADSGAAHVAFEWVNLAEAVSAACDKARVMTDARRQTLRVAFTGDEHAAVWGDYASLRRLTWILVDNAAKYTPESGVIHVTVAASLQHVALTVTDNGIGISEADLPHIFGRFYRADPSRGQVEGSGLGLAIAKWIVEIHGAAISAVSRENQGSTFQVTFPACVASKTCEQDRSAVTAA
jgi:heavy metal sensor kinase